MASHSSLESRLRERDESRKAAIEQRRVEREAGQRHEETADYYAQEYARKKAAIVELLESAGSLPKDQLTAHFNRVSAELQSLKKFVSDSSVFLPAFDLKSSQQQITQLLQDVSTRQDELLPKKKFAFKSRKKDNPAPSVQKEAKSEEQKSTASVTSGISDKMVGFKDQKNQKLQLNAEELLGQDVNLSSLSGCEVKLCGPPSTLHMSKMDNCTILCGPVSSSVFIEDCKESTFVVACQQLRVHSTVQSLFYLHVTSRAIIEDCSQVSFAPYNLTYPELDLHFKVTGLNKEINNWDTVDDFNWLASKDPSPNWTILPPDKRTNTFSIVPV